MSLQQIQTTYDEWVAEELTDGEALDYLIEHCLLDVDTNLIDYIRETDGDEMTDAEAIELVYFRSKQLNGSPLGNRD